MAAFLYVGGAVVGAGLAVVSAPVLLPALGFSSAGVVAGSTAAAVQATIGNVAAGSLFAGLQSAGAAGVSWATTATLGAIGGGTGGAGAAVLDYLLNGNSTG